MKTSPVLSILPLDFQWPVMDPFLFCAHHLDHYPPGNEYMGPAASLEGRDLGQDFTLRDGWRMYHGEVIPGFPSHPHRGFETVTIVMTGTVDHSDSHGQAGRYGGGDVQWMTAGSGLQHSEMFPLADREGDNPLELFQVWLNLPRARKFAEPHFKMLWSEDIPVYTHSDLNGKVTRVSIIAGSLAGICAAAPAPDSWAADQSNEVAIWTVRMEPGAEWTLPPAGPDLSRSLYFYRGDRLYLADTAIQAGQSAVLVSGQPAEIRNSGTVACWVLLQGKPIGEPVAKYGPFVMNTEEEIRDAIRDYRQTEFGGWPWPRRDMVHPREKGRFARHLRGDEEVK